jgi:hypothetical protein
MSLEREGIHLYIQINYRAEEKIEQIKKKYERNTERI